MIHPISDPIPLMIHPTNVLGRPPPQATPEKLWNLSRHVVASVYILYFQLAGGASDGGKQVTESEWQVLLQTGLLSQVSRHSHPIPSHPISSHLISCHLILHPTSYRCVQTAPSTTSQATPSRQARYRSSAQREWPSLTWFGLA